MLGCNVNTSVPESKEESAGPIASGSLISVTLWNKPVGSPGETGSISGNSPPPGSQVEVYENFIIVTPEDGIKWLSPHGWYSKLAFKADE